ncbi:MULTISPECIES: TfoX/Sxy family protein [Methylobacterium]|uniref:Competence protein TfoX n=2 Tax=Methylobacterium TaxID=407 RepID=A0A0C6F054_9HYPH|nr:TfoX/Sxy family protein [Methylobacterium aquaticum]QRE77204.1 TfoX/Sxy family protein [Methylobacterium aquaticum]BAQ45936.1 competence protein TfoX [Methylobacterium aquaticum]
MATKRNTVNFIVEQARGAGHVFARKMFGEYGLYCDGKLAALVCDEQLFLKPTAAGRALLGDGATEASPYPGAKPCFRIPSEAWDDPDRLSDLIKATAEALPVPPPKKRRRS